MTNVAVLGDSLSIVGYGGHGNKRVRDTWPRVMQSESGHNVCVSVYAEGRLTCAYETESKTYYGNSQQMAAAEGSPANTYVIMLGNE